MKADVAAARRTAYARTNTQTHNGENRQRHLERNEQRSHSLVDQSRSSQAVYEVQRGSEQSSGHERDELASSLSLPTRPRPRRRRPNGEAPPRLASGSIVRAPLLPNLPPLTIHSHLHYYIAQRPGGPAQSREPRASKTAHGGGSGLRSSQIIFF